MADTPVTPVTHISAAEAARHDSTKHTPPVVTHDGHIPHVGAAHGRTAPLIGLYRPYLLDVSADIITDNHLRVYADSAEDAIGIIVGGELPHVWATLTAAMADLPQSPITEEVITDELYGSFGSDLINDQKLSADDQARYEAHLAGLETIKDLQVQVAGLLAAHADTVRCIMQQRINDAAKADGRWDKLSAEEQTELELAADSGPDGRFPVGIVDQVPFVIYDDEDDGLQMAAVGYWSADVPLVCNVGDYVPWGTTFAPAPFMTRGDDDNAFLVPGTPNLLWLDIESPAQYLESLHKAGAVDMTFSPVMRPSELMRAFMEQHRQKTLEMLQDTPPDTDTGSGT